MMVKDEADIIGVTIAHLRQHVDQIIVSDNGSTDGTREILAGWEDGHMFVIDDPEVGYYQSAKMTALADRARDLGHDWVLPCDADEIWHVEETERSISDLLDGKANNVGIVQAQLFDHLTTDDDPPDADDPVERISWRRRDPAPLPKVCARLLPGLVIEQGNHGAHFPGGVATSGGLAIRHYPYRSLEQFCRKVENGAAAYKATDLPWSMGQHWREYGQHLERGGIEAIAEIYETWFHSEEPLEDPSLIYDPAPVRR